MLDSQPDVRAWFDFTNARRFANLTEFTARDEEFIAAYYDSQRGPGGGIWRARPDWAISRVTPNDSDRHVRISTAQQRQNMCAPTVRGRPRVRGAAPSAAAAAVSEQPQHWGAMPNELAQYCAAFIPAQATMVQLRRLSKRWYAALTATGDWLPGERRHAFHFHEHVEYDIYRAPDDAAGSGRARRVGKRARISSSAAASASAPASASASASAPTSSSSSSARHASHSISAFTEQLPPDPSNPESSFDPRLWLQLPPVRALSISVFDLQFDYPLPDESELPFLRELEIDAFSLGSFTVLPSLPRMPRLQRLMLSIHSRCNRRDLANPYECGNAEIAIRRLPALRTVELTIHGELEYPMHHFGERLFSCLPSTVTSLVLRAQMPSAPSTLRRLARVFAGLDVRRLQSDELPCANLRVLRVVLEPALTGRAAPAAPGVLDYAFEAVRLMSNTLEDTQHPLFHTGSIIVELRAHGGSGHLLTPTALPLWANFLAKLTLPRGSFVHARVLFVAPEHDQKWAIEELQPLLALAFHPRAHVHVSHPAGSHPTSHVLLIHFVQAPPSRSPPAAEPTSAPPASSSSAPSSALASGMQLSARQ